MKKIIYLLLFFLSSQGFCQIRISGTVKNAAIDTVDIKGLDRFPIKKVALKDGQFTLEVDLKDGFYSLGFGNESSQIFLEDGDELKLTADYSDFEKTLKFEGKGAGANNYLHQKGILSGKLTEDIEKFYDIDPNVYKQNVENLIRKISEELDNSDVSETFERTELTNVQYQRLFFLFKYALFQEYYFERTVVQPQEFMDAVKDLNTDDAESYASYPYYRYIVEQIWEDEIAEQTTFFSMRIKFDQIRTPELRMMMFIKSFYQISKEDVKAEAYYKLVRALSTSERFSEMARLEYEKVKDLQKGKPAPNFTYEDINGKQVSLGDFKGKYVYIDIWATWCKPCIAQIPDLKQLEKDYHDKKIVFVSISVDKPKAKEKWKKMVQKKGLGGVQLLADNAFESAFVDKFGVSSIPSFILLDPDGNIVQRRSSKPTSPKIRQMFDALLEK